MLIRSMLPARFGWLFALTLLWFGSASALPKFALFESDQVRPLALSPSGQYLYAVNTPDNRLEIFQVTRDGGLEHIDSVPVGLEPVAVAARDEGEVWVTNILSDSVSVVDVRNPHQGVVERTLLVGDEPRDIVFAGQGHKRAFVTTAHRGQNAPFDPQLATPGIGRADVWVFDADNLGNKLGGAPLTIITLFSDTPRALAVSPDGSRVYAAGFHTGNRTTVASPLVNPPFTLPPPTTNFAGEAQPLTSLIVKFDGQHWVDELNRQFDPLVMFSLPDKDVFVIDANGRPPAQLAGSAGYFTSVGTILYNMAVNPVSGKIYVSNTEALNQNRFEGPGIFAGHSVRGNFNHSRITILGQDGVTPRHLNKHIDYSTCCAAVPNKENRLSLAFPTGMDVSPDGRTLYVAALGSSKVGIYDTQALERDTFFPDEADQVQVSGGGPTGLVLDSRLGRLYVLTRFDDGISIVDVKHRAEVGKVHMHNPEPAKIVRGRRFMYDATLSSHGDSACASCHVFGDKDDLAWDLGNPDNLNAQNNNPIGLSVINVFPLPPDPTFVAMKGPMTTQSLRGMSNAGPMHWRGDRTGSKTEPNAQPDSGAFDEREAFRQFQAAFTDLVGTPGPLPDADMQAFTDFVLEMMYPPNPIRNLDNSLTPQQQLGRDIFVNRPTESVMQGRTPCEGCHTLDPGGNAQLGAEFPGFFGTQGKSSLESDQAFKVAHLRNLYTKVGKFGMPGFPPIIEDVPGAMGFQGDQIRGFGLSHAGDFDTVVRFTSATGFSQSTVFGPNPDGFPVGEAGLPLRHAVESFLFAFDSNLKPIVGQQATLTDWNSGAVSSRIDLLIARAEAGDCDLVAKGRFDGHSRGFLYVGSNQFKPDRSAAPLIGDAALRAEISRPNEALTYTCVPPGSGYRIGIDQDNNGTLDGDKRQK